MKKLIETYKNTKVLVTGHTGFKGSWLSIWLNMLGAEVIGFSLPELPSKPSNFELANVKDIVLDIRGDVRDFDKLGEIIKRYKPDIIFHLAAQPIVLTAYDDPKTTFEINAMGTMNIMEAAKGCNSVKAIVSITSDKVYRNKEWVWGYREEDELGDTDPYSASKAMAELVIRAYRGSYFSNKNYNGNKPKVASARAGNVIGGGDFADKRMIPDCVRALMQEKEIELRNPKNIRPWQHVLEPLSGYLWLGAVLLNNETDEYSQAWNFGPQINVGVTAAEVADISINVWGRGSWKNTGNNENKKEAGLLFLDFSKASNILGWQPVYTTHEALSETVNWYKEYKKRLDRKGENVDMQDYCLKQIENYSIKALEKGIKWALYTEEIE